MDRRVGWMTSYVQMRDLSPLAESLALGGYAVQPEFFSASEILTYREDLLALRERGLLTQAGVGKGTARTEAPTIRGDRIFWFENEAGATPAQKRLLEFTEAVKAKLNSELFLGLWSVEAHYASYAQGSFYKRHSDVFKNSDARVVSFILYLNENDWRVEDGGQLRLYLPPNGAVRAETSLDVIPRGGTLVCFMSDAIEHEVLIANRDRFSFTGWFRRRS